MHFESLKNRLIFAQKWKVWFRQQREKQIKQWAKQIQAEQING